MKIKRIICAILAVMTLALCCVGCGGKEKVESTTPEAVKVVNASYTDFFYVTDGIVAFKTAENRIGLLDGELNELVKAEYTDVKYCEGSNACILTKADGTTVAYSLEKGKFTEDVCAHGGIEYIVWDSASKAPVYGPDNSPLSKSDYPEKGQTTFVLDSATQKFGLMDSDGKLVVEPIYEEIGGFVGGVSAVKKGGYWGYINMNGTELVGFYYSDAYTSVSCLSEGKGGVYNMVDGEVAVIRDNMLAGIYSQNGQMLCKFIYRNIISLGNGSYLAMMNDGVWVTGTASALNNYTK